jgi:benzoyl-CoA reductase subunit A
MRTFIGIDLGSTTTKAVLLDENRDVIGRGITNSRSNYATAARVASEEARIDGRFTLFRRALSSGEANVEVVQAFLGALERNFRLVQFLEQLGDLEETCLGQLQTERFAKVADRMGEALNEVFRRLRAEAPDLYAPGAVRRSDFFRDIAGSRFHVHADAVAEEAGVSHEILLNAYDKSIIEVENRPPSGGMSEKFHRAMDRVLEIDPHLIDGANDVPARIEDTLGLELEETYLVGTGYGRCIRTPARCLTSAARTPRASRSMPPGLWPTSR